MLDVFFDFEFYHYEQPEQASERANAISLSGKKGLLSGTNGTYIFGQSDR